MEHPTCPPSEPLRAQLDQLIDLVPMPFKPLHGPITDHTFIDAIHLLLGQCTGLAVAFRWALTVEDVHLDLEPLANGLEVLTEYLQQTEKVCDTWWQTSHGRGSVPTPKEGRA